MVTASQPWSDAAPDSAAPRCNRFAPVTTARPDPMWRRWLTVASGAHGRHWRATLLPTDRPGVGISRLRASGARGEAARHPLDAVDEAAAQQLGLARLDIGDQAHHLAEDRV